MMTIAISFKHLRLVTLWKGASFFRKSSSRFALWSGKHRPIKTVPGEYSLLSSNILSLKLHTTKVGNDDLILKSPLPDLHIPESTLLLDYITQNWHQFGDKMAFIDSHTMDSITYNELWDKFHRFGSSLMKQGFKKGDVVTICLPNCIEFAIVYYGAMSIGMIVNAVNPASTTAEMIRALYLVESRLFIVTPSTAAKAKQCLIQCPTIKNVICIGGSEGFLSLTTLLKDDGECLPIKLDVDVRNDVATLSFSSGTTGLPKAVMLTHYCIVANLLQMGTENMLNMTRDDIQVNVLPLFHAVNHITLLYSNHVGATSILMAAFHADSYLQNIQQYKATFLIGVPPLLAFFANYPEIEKYDLTSVRCFEFAGAPASPYIISAAKQRLSGNTDFMQAYGMTELSPYLTMTPRYRIRSDTAGVPVHNSALKIRHIETGELLGPNQEGEICGYGPQIMKGYWKNEKATKETIVDGWLHTGDIGFYDNEGFLVITDRLKELIKYKGFQVAPAELEGLLLSHPAVQDAAVIGKPDDRAGEFPKAYVVLKEDAKATEEDIQSFVKAKAAPQKYLRGGVEFRSEIPKSASGKILRRILKDELIKAMR